MPKDFHLFGNKSMNQLFKESGYLEKPNLVTKETLTFHLIANPELVSDWENYSWIKEFFKDSIF